MTNLDEWTAGLAVVVLVVEAARVGLENCLPPTALRLSGRQVLGSTHVYHVPTYLGSHALFLNLAANRDAYNNPRAKNSGAANAGPPCRLLCDLAPSSRLSG